MTIPPNTQDGPEKTSRLLLEAIEIIQEVRKMNAVPPQHFVPDAPPAPGHSQRPTSALTPEDLAARVFSDPNELNEHVSKFRSYIDGKRAGARAAKLRAEKEDVDPEVFYHGFEAVAEDTDGEIKRVDDLSADAAPATSADFDARPAVGHPDHVVERLIAEKHPGGERTWSCPECEKIVLIIPHGVQLVPSDGVRYNCPKCEGRFAGPS